MTSRPYQKSRFARPGFSLVEMLVVIFIAGILIAITVGAIGAMNKMGAKSQTQAIISALDAALDQTKDATGEYPRVSGSFLQYPSGIINGTQAQYGEAIFMTQALNALAPNRLDASKAALDSNNSVMSILKPYLDNYSSAIPSDLTNFRLASYNGLPITAAQATVDNANLDLIRPARTSGTISFLRDAWDRYIVYFPSDTSVTTTDTAATLRPMFASPGADGILQSTPWSSSPPAPYAVNSCVYYKQRWYRSTAASNTTTPGVSTTWQEITSDDIITRGDWR